MKNDNEYYIFVNEKKTTILRIPGLKILTITYRLFHRKYLYRYLFYPSLKINIKLFNVVQLHSLSIKLTTRFYFNS